ncbi:hypothetical protein ONV78_29095 [Hahella sp. CR1]|uniref:pYEATS domain-containing protein n=1 Tax=Hahella sp. CR1 TaxID=2992807 RepID=UPI002441919F|nr:pYEATS domain-containing protein [Hahella sp. CR1]MDG9671828.1 hypothetical protein [Hahella sp. CR1]
MDSLNTFSSAAKDLSRNPLGIIALFIVLVYGFACLVVTNGDSLLQEERLTLVWFLALFPCVVLGVFGWLVSRHHTKLYGPGDLKDESLFFRSHEMQLINLPVVPQTAPDNTPAIENGVHIDTMPGRSKDRDEQYGKNRGFFIVHSYSRAEKRGQQIEIFIYLIRHKSEEYSDVAKAEFFLGRYWGNRIIEGKRSGDIIGMRTSAYGPFLCTCLVTFQDGEQVMLHRYIDFEMAQA